VRVIYSSLDPNEVQGPIVAGPWGPVSLQGAQEDYIKLEDKLDAHVKALEREHQTTNRRRLRKQIERLDAELTRLHQALYPVAQNEGDDVEVIDTGVLSCRSSACPRQLTKQLAFQTLGFCPPCWNRASGKDS
jgi:hypothetical protein